MPVLEAPLYAYLEAELDPLLAGGVLPVRGSEGEPLPYVTYQRASAQRSYTHDPFGEERAWVTARISFNCWAAEYLTAVSIGEAIVQALSGFSGPLEDELSIGRCDVVLEQDLYEESTKLYRRVVDVLFAYEEGVVGS